MNGLWKSKVLVILLLEGGELMPSDGGRLIRELGSSTPFMEPDEEDEVFKRKEKRSKRDPAESVTVPRSPNSFRPILIRLFEFVIVSGSELVPKIVR